MQFFKMMLHIRPAAQIHGRHPLKALFFSEGAGGIGSIDMLLALNAGRPASDLTSGFIFIHESGLVATVRVAAQVSVPEKFKQTPHALQVGFPVLAMQGRCGPGKRGWHVCEAFIDVHGFSGLGVSV